MKARQPSKATERGPIHLEIDVPPTATRCGVRYNIHLDAKQAATVRRAARLLGMETTACIQAILDGELYAGVRRLSTFPKLPPGTFRCMDPALLARVEAAARYYGYANAEEYLAERMETKLWSDEEYMVVHPRHRRPVLEEKFWEEVEKLVGVDRPQWVADPLNYPGFLDRFPNRDPWAEPEKELPRDLWDDPRLLPPKVQLAAA